MAKKVKQDTEYGYRTPDGKEYFPQHDSDPHQGPPIGYADLDTARGQEKVRENYRRILVTQGVPEELADKLEFIQRVRTVTLSKVIPLPPREVSPLDEEDEEAPHHRLARKPAKAPRPF